MRHPRPILQRASERAPTLAGAIAIALVAGLLAAFGDAAPAGAAVIETTGSPQREFEQRESGQRAPEQRESEQRAPEQPGERPGAPAATASTGIPARGLTVPGGPNEVVGDVRGLGTEQVIRLNGSQVEIVEPQTDGGSVLNSFEAGTNEQWPAKRGFIPIFSGQRYLAGMGHEASRVAVLEDAIYVSSVSTREDDATEETRPAGSSVRKYSAEGELLAERVFQDDVAVTSLDAFRHDGTAYLAIGLNRGGVRVAYAEQRGLPDAQTVHPEWGVDRPDQTESVTVAELGVDADGDLLVVAGRVASGGHPTVTAVDVATGADQWQNYRVPYGAFAWPNQVAIGPFGPSGRPQVAISYPLIGRVSFVDAATGADWTYLDRGDATYVRFYDNAAGEHRVAINADRAIIGGVGPGGRFVDVATSTRDLLPWLIRVW
jgi:hypothetical protein